MRVAVYFTPPQGHPLVRTAARWLGRDAFTGEAMDRGAVPGLESAEIDELTADPRRYGFHATLKAPFALAEGCTLAALRTFAAGFAVAHAPAMVPALALTTIGPFFVLAGAEPAPAVDALAAAVVHGFEGFRAPMAEQEVARRQPDSLSARQRENLATWGYPYVLDDFRFHMTLTGPVPEARRDAMRAALLAIFGPFLDGPLVVDRLALFVEPERPGSFVVDTLVALGGSRRAE